MRKSVTNSDSSRWAYGYDNLGQVTSGKRYWSDGNIVPGQEFEYGFDDIGNRLSAGSGGDQYGVNLRYRFYSVNNVNQYTQRTVPGGGETVANPGGWGGIMGRRGGTGGRRCSLMTPIGGGSLGW